MCPNQQFWQGDYLSTSCQNVAISEDPGRVAQMILSVAVWQVWLRWSPPISDRQVSVMTRSQDTRLLFRPSPTQRHCTICWWVTRLGKGEVGDEGQVLDFVDYLGLGEESLCETELPWDDYFEKRVVRRSWFEIGDSSLTDRTGEGGADHLEQRRSNPLIIGKKNLASDCHRDHHHHCQQDHKQGHQGAFQKRQVNKRKKTTHVPINTYWKCLIGLQTNFVVKSSLNLFV